jgi:hypothetical protein
MRTISLLCTLLLLIIGIIGCTKKDNDGALEKAGERLDQAVENIKDGESPLKEKGTMEKLGEAVDKKVDPEK